MVTHETNNGQPVVLQNLKMKPYHKCHFMAFYSKQRNKKIYKERDATKVKP